MIFATIRKNGFHSEKYNGYNGVNTTDIALDSNRNPIEASKAYQTLAEDNRICRLPTRKNNARLRSNLNKMREARLNQA